MSKLVTEFIGTFFLVLTVGLAVVQGLALAPLIIGSSLMIMVYMGGHISGAHYNPAVSLALFLKGKIPTGDLIFYWISQLLGAIAAAMWCGSYRERPLLPPRLTRRLRSLFS